MVEIALAAREHESLTRWLARRYSHAIAAVTVHNIPGLGPLHRTIFPMSLALGLSGSTRPGYPHP